MITPFCMLQYLVWTYSFYLGTKPTEFYSRGRMVIKSVMSIISGTLSAYMINLSLTSLDDGISEIKNDIAYVFTFNIAIQSYVLLYYLTIGNAKSDYFKSLASGLVSNIVNESFAGVKNITLGVVDASSSLGKMTTEGVKRGLTLSFKKKAKDKTNKDSDEEPQPNISVEDQATQA